MAPGGEQLAFLVRQLGDARVARGAQLAVGGEQARALQAGRDGLRLFLRGLRLRGRGAPGRAGGNHLVLVGRGLGLHGAHLLFQGLGARARLVAARQRDVVGHRLQALRLAQGRVSLRGQRGGLGLGRRLGRGRDLAVAAGGARRQLGRARLRLGGPHARLELGHGRAGIGAVEGDEQGRPSSPRRPCARGCARCARPTREPRSRLVPSISAEPPVGPRNTCACERKRMPEQRTQRDHQDREHDSDALHGCQRDEQGPCRVGGEHRGGGDRRGSTVALRPPTPSALSPYRQALTMDCSRSAKTLVAGVPARRGIALVGADARGDLGDGGFGTRVGARARPPPPPRAAARARGRPARRSGSPRPARQRRTTDRAPCTRRARCPRCGRRPADS